MPKKSKKKNENQLEEHNEFWVNINQNFEESKMGSFDMIDTIQSKFSIDSGKLKYHLLTLLFFFHKFAGLLSFKAKFYNNYK